MLSRAVFTCVDGVFAKVEASADAADTAAAWERAGGIAIDRIWVQGLGDDSVMAFTDFGVESLVELIKIHRESTPTGER
jgi:hypothetical protein